MNPLRQISWLIKIWRIIYNSRIAFLSSRWASRVQELANDFSIIQHNIDKKHKYGNSKEVLAIAEKLEETNKKTHSLWSDMKNNLKLK